MPRYPSKVVIREVGLRDGLQSIQTILPTERKKEWIRDAYDAGQREIEVGSFVPARLLPQLADTAEVLAYAKTLPGLFASVLVPNLKGAERAIESKADLLLVPLSASHAHSLANLRKTPDEVIAEVGRIRAARDAAGSKTLIEGGIGTAFGCTIQGRVEPSEVLRCMQGLLDAGADRVSIADTVGYADPAVVRDLFEQAVRIAGDRFWCGHFHDTRGLALANVYASLEVGVDRFDATLAGIGGCPHAPGASGNASTEDLAFMLASMGLSTGIDIERLLALRAKVAEWLKDETLHGTLWLAGLPRGFAARKPVGRTDAATLTQPSPASGRGLQQDRRGCSAARRNSRHRVHPHGDGPDLRDDPRRPGRRSDQDRAARRRQDAQAAGARHRLLPLVQPQQEKRRARHQLARRPCDRARFDRRERRGARKLPARPDDRSSGSTTRRCRRNSRA